MIDSYQNQLRKVQDLQTKAEQLVNKLHNVQMLDQDCIDANTEENDYTVYSVEDLTFGLDLLQQALQKKNAFIQNQVRKRYDQVLPVHSHQFCNIAMHFFFSFVDCFP